MNAIEISAGVDALKEFQKRAEYLEQENARLRQERDEQVDEVMRLSNLLRNKATDQELEFIASYKPGDVITQEEALFLTVSRLRTQVGELEDEREFFQRRIASLEARVGELNSVDEARLCKIRALEGLITCTKHETSSHSADTADLTMSSSISSWPDDDASEGSTERPITAPVVTPEVKQTRRTIQRTHSLLDSSTGSGLSERPKLTLASVSARDFVNSRSTRAMVTSDGEPAGYPRSRSFSLRSSGTLSSSARRLSTRTASFGVVDDAESNDVEDSRQWLCEPPPQQTASPQSTADGDNLSRSSSQRLSVSIEEQDEDGVASRSMSMSSAVSAGSDSMHQYDQDEGADRLENASRLIQAVADQKTDQSKRKSSRRKRRKPKMPTERLAV